MAYTALSVSATPGKPHTFSAKEAAPAEAAGPHTGLFTELSVTALPGKIHSFSAKDAAAVVAGGDHTGLFTALSVLATPGPRHSFTAKTAAEAAEAETSSRPETSFAGARARRIKRRRYEELLNDDIEVMMLLKKIVESGILE